MRTIVTFWHKVLLSATDSVSRAELLLGIGVATVVVAALFVPALKEFQEPIQVGALVVLVVLFLFHLLVASPARIWAETQAMVERATSERDLARGERDKARRQRDEARRNRPVVRIGTLIVSDTTTVTVGTETTLANLAAVADVATAAGASAIESVLPSLPDEPSKVPSAEEGDLHTLEHNDLLEDG